MMATEPTLEIKIKDYGIGIRTKLQNKLLLLLNNNQVKIGVNNILLKAITPYVPKDTGELRKSTNVTPDTISWNTEYAHYQYEGDVYGPNLPGINEGEPAWLSGHTKHPMGRKLGEYGIAFLYPKWEIVNGEFRNSNFTSPEAYILGYKTSGTTYHWIDEMWKNDKRLVQLQITNYLKQEAKKLGD